MSPVRIPSVLLAGAIACVAAAPMAGVAPTLTPGVRVSTLGLSPSAFASVSPHKHERKPVIARVLLDDQYVVASTSAAAFWFDRQGQEARRLAFPRKLGHVGVARLHAGGPPILVGSTDSVGRKLLLVPCDGGPPWSLRLGGYRATFANVLGDDEYEIVAHHMNEFLIYNPRGDLLKRVSASDYIWDFVALNTNASPHDEILAYLYQNKRDGTFIEILDAEGERIRSWHEPEANRYSVSNWSAPAPSVIAVLDSAITERSPRGEVLRRYTVPGLGSYRYAHSGVLADGSRLVLVTSGSCPSRLLAFDAAGALVYDEVFATYAALHVPTYGAAEFFVGLGATIYRYRLEATTPAAAAVPRP